MYSKQCNLFSKLIHNENKRRINERLVVQWLCFFIECSAHSSLITKWGYVLSKRFSQEIYKFGSFGSRTIIEE